MTEATTKDDLFVNPVIVPPFIEKDGLGYYDIEAIANHGCESGAYMPAVTYHSARKTMGEHGNEVLEWIEERRGEIPPVPDDTRLCGWDHICVFYLSIAVEIFAQDLLEGMCGGLAHGHGPTGTTKVKVWIS